MYKQMTTQKMNKLTPTKKDSNLSISSKAGS